MEDLIAEEDGVITLTQGNYIKRLPADTFRSQKRGGRGITGMATKEEDAVEDLFQQLRIIILCSSLIVVVFIA